MDFKRELPGRGKGAEAAKDVAAMSVDGGLLIYGLDEDKTTGEATSVIKFPLAGASERLQAMIGAHAAPSPPIEIVPVKEQPGDTEGVLVVAVQPSAQAPHMVGGRYPVRRGTTTEFLSEADVARAYERRRSLAGPPATSRELLEDFADPPSVWEGGSGSFLNGQGVIRLVVRPQAPGGSHRDSPWLADALNQATISAAQKLGGRIVAGSEGQLFASIARWSPLGTVGWTSGVLPDQNMLMQHPGLAATFKYPASLSVLISLPLFVNDPNSGQETFKCAWEWLVAAELLSALALSGEIFEGVRGAGPLACLLSLSGWDNAVPFYVSHGRVDALGSAPQVPSSVITTSFAAVPELRTEPEAVGRRLLDPWLASFYLGRELFGAVLQS